MANPLTHAKPHQAMLDVQRGSHKGGPKESNVHPTQDRYNTDEISGPPLIKDAKEWKLGCEIVQSDQLSGKCSDDVVPQ